MQIHIRYSLRCEQVCVCVCVCLVVTRGSSFSWLCTCTCEDMSRHNEVSCASTGVCWHSDMNSFTWGHVQQSDAHIVHKCVFEASPPLMHSPQIHVNHKHTFSDVLSLKQENPFQCCGIRLLTIIYLSRCKLSSAVSVYDMFPHMTCCLRARAYDPGSVCGVCASRE